MKDERDRATSSAASDARAAGAAGERRAGTGPADATGPAAAGTTGAAEPGDAAETERRVLERRAAESGDAAETERRVLERRAAVLARRPRRERPVESIEVAVFRLGREQFAIELGCLLQIFPLRDLALLPGARPPLVGLTPWRGGLLRVLDLGAALGRAQAGIADRGRVLALAAGERAAFGVLIDTVDDVRLLPLPEIRPLPARADDELRLVRGVTRDAVLVLDGEQLIRTYD